MPTDKFSVRAVIIAFVVISWASLAAMIGLALLHRTIPQNLDRAFTFTTGALVGVIAKTTTSEPGAPIGGTGGVNVTEAPAVVVAPGDGQ